MTGQFRTPAGGRDRSRPAAVIQFRRQAIHWLPGDTLASALLANGVHLVGRSFKYHRPRGILSAGSEEPNALVTIDRGPGRVTPNLRATQLELYDGLQAHSQNRFPSLGFDVGAVSNAIGHCFRRASTTRPSCGHAHSGAICMSLPSAPLPVWDVRQSSPDPDGIRSNMPIAMCWLSARAQPVSRQRLPHRRVARASMLCDEQAELGGSLLAETQASDRRQAGRPFGYGTRWQLSIKMRTSRCFHAPPRSAGFLIISSGWQSASPIISAKPEPQLPRERLWQVRAQEVIIAAGAIERPLVFSGNDRPGVMLADAARHYLLRYGVTVGARAVMVTSDDTAYAAATALQQAGVAISRGCRSCAPRRATLHANPVWTCASAQVWWPPAAVCA